MAVWMRTGSAAVAGAIIATSLMAGTPPAAAQGTFLDRLFRSPGYVERRRQAQQLERQQRQRAVKRVRISSPRTYNYKPDVLKAISLDALATIKLAKADPDPALSGSDPAAAGDDQRNGSGIAPTPFDQARGALSGFRLRALAEVGAAIKAHYAANPHFIWVTDVAVNDRARSALAVLERAGEYGLRPAHYRVPVPAAPTYADTPESRRREMMAFEMRLSAAVLTYALDATRGRVAPNRLSGYHDLPRHKVDLEAVLAELAGSDQPGELLEARHPDNAAFAALKAELAALKAADDDNAVTIAEGTLLKPGARDPQLANVVTAIKLRGSDELHVKHAVVLAAYNGEPDYSGKLVELVRDFQRENKLGADGIIGRNTIRALVGVTNQIKINRVVLAMERLRWLPHQFGERHVFINQAAYTATYFAPDREPLSMRVVVGKKSNQTNFFYDEIETVEYNPYWGVPKSIIVNEMLPKLSRDPSYLDRLGYEVTTASGQRVSSSMVDWWDVAANATPINVRQPPGPKNALGKVKILFPNKHAIYMHDTPAKKLFSRDTRAYSHGCVRLQHPQEMAAAVLGKPVDYVHQQIAKGRNESEAVAGNVKVYSAYFTAWPKLEGGIGYYADVYGRDASLIKALEKTDLARDSIG